MILKLLSWNIWYHCDFTKAAEFLASADADIIGLQEVVPDDPARDIIGHLAKLGYHHVVAPVLKIPNDGRTMSNAVFSKHGIVGTETVTLSEEESRNAVRADVRIGDKILHVFSTHLLHTHQQPSDIQALQAENLIQAVPAERSIVMGDFNATPDSAVIRKMRQAMVDIELASPPTLDVTLFDCPVCVRDREALAGARLDYIFTSKDLKASGFKVHGPAGSDHLPVSAVVEI